MLGRRRAGGVPDRLYFEKLSGPRVNKDRHIWRRNSLTAEGFYSSNGYLLRKRGEHVLQDGQRMACVKMRKTIGLRTNSNDCSRSI